MISRAVKKTFSSSHARGIAFSLLVENDPAAARDLIVALYEKHRFSQAVVEALGINVRTLRRVRARLEDRGFKVPDRVIPKRGWVPERPRDRESQARPRDGSGRFSRGTRGGRKKVLPAR